MPTSCGDHVASHARVHLAQAPLEPVVLPGEERRYVPGVSAEAQLMYHPR